MKNLLKFIVIALIFAAGYGVVQIEYNKELQKAPVGQVVDMQQSRYPNPTLTPGVILTTDTAKVCTRGYASTVRNVPESVKNQVYKEYGITSHTPNEYEIDHFISLELGGSNDIKNLWPELNDHYKGYLHSKDVVEDWLHTQVCSNKITLEEAQREIRTDWYKVLKDNTL